MNWLIVGITGGTCSGKSTLAKSIVDHINSEKVEFPENISIGTVKLMKQDDFFYPKTSSEHTWIPEFNYINREILSALNMTKMCADMNEILGFNYQPYSKLEGKSVLNILVIEGFLIFNCKEIRDKCQIKFCMQLSYEECFSRRQNRKYNPPNPPGYFEKILWPFYLKHYDEYKDIDDMQLLNGELSEDVCLHKALEYIVDYL